MPIPRLRHRTGDGLRERLIARGGRGLFFAGVSDPVAASSGQVGAAPTCPEDALSLCLPPPSWLCYWLCYRSPHESAPSGRSKQAVPARPEKRFLITQAPKIGLSASAGARQPAGTPRPKLARPSGSRPEDSASPWSVTPTSPSASISPRISRPRTGRPSSTARSAPRAPCASTTRPRRIAPRASTASRSPNQA